MPYHYSKSDNLAKAIVYLKLSAQKATKSNANWDAYRYYEQAIQILDEMPKSDENIKNTIETCLLIAAPLSLLGYHGNSLNILLKGESLANQSGDRLSLARSRRNLAHCFSPTKIKISNP